MTLLPVYFPLLRIFKQTFLSDFPCLCDESYRLDLLVTITLIPKRFTWWIMKTCTAPLRSVPINCNQSQSVNKLSFSDIIRARDNDGRSGGPVHSDEVDYVLCDVLCHVLCPTNLTWMLNFYIWMYWECYEWVGFTVMVYWMVCCCIFILFM